MEVLKRGQERFNIYCTPCHSRVGNGLGEIVQRGYKPAANLHDQVRLAQPLSHYFYVMTHGYGAMPDYSAQLDAGRSLGGRGLHPRTAAEPGGHGAGCALRRAGAEPEGYCRAARTCRPASRSPGRCPRRRCRLIRTTKEGTPAMAPANPADPLIKIPASKPAPAAAK